MNRNKLTTIGVFALLVALGVASRLVKEICPLLPPNFHAIVGTALFAGFFLPNRVLAAVVPLAAMWLSDLVIGGYETLVMVAVYSSLMAPVAWQGWLRRRVSVARVAGAAVASSMLFFVTTNLAVWYVWYPHTIAGISRCYLAALPFLRYTLSGDLLFAGALFGAYALATRPATQTAGSLPVAANAAV